MTKTVMSIHLDVGQMKAVFQGVVDIDRCFGAKYS